MDYFIRLLEEKLHTLQERERQVLNLVIQEAKSGRSIGIAAPNMIETITVAREHLAVAGERYERSHEVKYEVIKELALNILSGYEQNSLVVVNSSPDLNGLAQELRRGGNKISCVSLYKGWIFDPRIERLWRRHNIKPKDNLKMYLHNLNGKEHMLDSLVRFIGDVEKEEEATDMNIYRVINKSGLHLRPTSSIVEIFQMYNRDVEVKVERDATGKTEKANGKGMLGVLALGATKGAILTVKYVPPKNDEERAQLREVRKQLDNLVDERECGKEEKVLKKIS